MRNKITVSEDEINVDITVKDTVLTIIMAIFPLLIFIGLIVIILVGLSYIFGDIKPVYYLPIIFLFGPIIYNPIAKGLFWKTLGTRSITFDPKYIIIYDTIGIKLIQKVFKISNICRITIDPDYRVTFWTKIKAFLTRDSGGCICMCYEGKPVRFGYGLTIKEAKELLSLLKEKHLIDTVEG